MNDQIKTAIEALEKVVGCFEAAQVEGLDDVLTTEPDYLRLKDLVRRRLMYADQYAKDALLAIEESTALTASAAPQAQQEAGKDAQDSVPHMIVFDDADRKPEMFIGRDAALRRYEQVSTSWNAHLFVKIDSNSRDCPYPSAAMQASPAQAETPKCEKCGGSTCTVYGMPGTVCCNSCDHMQAEAQQSKGESK